MPSSLIARLLKRSKVQEPITVVSGLPRSGTSMLMQILQAGGMPILSDNLRKADADNPKGYLEFERVKKLKEGDTKWIKEASGKAVKVISALLEYLPAQYPYKIIFMQRDIDEILASQHQMLIRQNVTADQVSNEKMAELFRQHLKSVENWLNTGTNMEVLFIDYAELMQDPNTHIGNIVRFLGRPLQVEAMLAIPDKTLYRQRQYK